MQTQHMRPIGTRIEASTSHNVGADASLLRAFHLFTVCLFLAFAALDLLAWHGIHASQDGAGIVVDRYALLALLVGAVLFGLQYTLHRWAGFVICALTWAVSIYVLLSPMLGQMGVAAFLLILILPLVPMIETDFCLREFRRRK